MMLINHLMNLLKINPQNIYLNNKCNKIFFIKNKINIKELNQTNFSNNHLQLNLINNQKKNNKLQRLIIY